MDKLLWLYLRCKKCDNRLKIVINPVTDLIRGYSTDEPAFTLHKETLDNKCLSQIVIDITYTKDLKIVSQDIKGACFIGREEFEKE